MTDSRKGTVYLVDDDEDVLRGLGRLLRSAGYDVAAFSSAEEFLAAEAEDLPACLVLDVRMPGLEGPELQERLVAAGSSLPIIFLSGHADVPTSVRAMKRGATDFLEKPVEDVVLLRAVEAGLERSRKEGEERVEVGEIRRRLARLTEREREVLEQILTGALNKQIAGVLGIAEQTVKLHRAQVMRKMEADSVVRLVRLCARAQTSSSSG